MKADEEKLLYTEDGRVVTVSGKYLFSVAMTNRAKELTDDVGWDKKHESWLAYRNRTKSERIAEEYKRVQMARDIVNAYNNTFNLD